MKLYEQWFRKAYTTDGKINVKLWDDFMPKEQKIYEYILENKLDVLEGTISEFAEKFNMSTVYILGFIDGINDAQKEPVKVQELDENSKVSLKIDYEVLYKKMVEYKADHLANLPQWKNIFSEEKLKSLYKGQRSSRTIVKQPKIELNEPCPCGSGKKYKKCCGAN